MKKLRLPLIDIVRPFVGAILGIALILATLSIRLSTVGPGIGVIEAPTIHSVQARSVSLRHILLEDPLFLPYKAGTYALEKAGLTNLAAIRAIGVFFGAVAVVSLYLILRHWHTRRIAILGSVLFLTSSGLLHAARLAVPETSYLLIVPLIFLGIKLQGGKRPFVFLSLVLLLAAAVLYLPGLVWLLVPVFLWQRKRLLQQAREVNAWALSVTLLLAVVILAPLFYALVTQDDFWKLWLGYQRPFVSPLVTLKIIGNTLGVIFVRGPLEPSLNVGRLPLLDIATSVFAVLGLYWYFFQRKLDRTKLLLGGLLFGVLLITAYGNMAQSVLLPFIYIFAASGIALLLQQWFTVFPRNPLARGIGIGLITLLVAAISFYHLQRYFVAWPHTLGTKAVFTTER